MGNETPKTLAQTMVEFTFGLHYDSIPAEVTTAARRYLADSIACALGAYDAEAARSLRRYAIEKGGRAEATILGTDRKVPAGLAALVNGTMVRHLDANDIFVFSRGGASGHCSDGTPGLLALAEQHGRSGEEPVLRIGRQYARQTRVLAPSFSFPRAGELVAWSRILDRQEAVWVVNPNGQGGAMRGGDVVVAAELWPPGTAFVVRANTAEYTPSPTRMPSIAPTTVQSRTPIQPRIAK